MLSEEALDKIVERLANRIEQANEYVLNEIGKSIKYIGTLKPTNAIQLSQIIKYGGDYNKIVKKLAQITNLNIKDIEQIFEEVAKSDYRFAGQFYKYRGVKYIPYEYNDALKRQVNAITNLMVDNYIIRTKAIGFSIKDINDNIVFKPLEDAYKDILDKAILSISQGKTAFQDEMYKTIKEFASSGLKTLDYESGRTMRLDSAIKMNMKDALRQLHNEEQKLFGEEFGADGVEISVHNNPAIDHELVQGRQFSNDEYNKLQESGIATTYDNIKIDLHRELKNSDKSVDFRPISQYNCYHYIFPIILGASEPEYSNKQLQQIIEKNDKGFDFEGKHYSMYEGTQLQRKLETEIRKQKDIQIMAKASDSKDLIRDSQERITQLTNKYRDLSKISGLPTKMQRMRVSGYKRVHI